MEQNLPIVTKKFWNLVRVVYFMMRKGISVAKIFENVSIIIKRSKIAGKAALHSLLLHHQFAVGQRPDTGRHLEYEYSCSNTPDYSHPIFHFRPFHPNKRRNGSHALPRFDGDVLTAALGMVGSTLESPGLPGFGSTPTVRQLRITDSPFPLREAEEDDSVDAAAEDFIMKFYKDLRRQN